MTVCVAAMCQYGGSSVIIGASDRMMTSGNIEFEQAQTKIYHLTRAISIMIAGDIVTQTDVLLKVIHTVDERVTNDPTNWWKVKDIADLFYLELMTLKNQQAEQSILAPLQLNFEKLTSPDVAPELAIRLAKEVLEFEIPRIEALIIGIDTRVHIYEVNNEGVACQDWVGFSSIGIGAGHANSQLMFAGHVKTRALAETMLTVYTAKRRAEVAPGVGEQTDMVVIGPGLGSTTTVGTSLMEELKATYSRARAKAEKVRLDANAKITSALEKILRESAVQPQAPAELEATRIDAKEEGHEEIPRKPAEDEIEPMASKPQPSIG